MRIIRKIQLEEFEKNALDKALAYVNSYANLSSRLGQYEEANALYWLKNITLDTFSKPEGILLKSSLDYGYRLYSVYNLSSHSFLQPIDGEEAENLSKNLPLKVDTYLGTYKADELEEFNNLYEAVKVIYNFMDEVDESFTWGEEEYQFFLLEESKGKTLEALKEEQEKEEDFYE